MAPRINRRDEATVLIHVQASMEPRLGAADQPPYVAKWENAINWLQWSRGLAPRINQRTLGHVLTEPTPLQWSRGLAPRINLIDRV